MADTYDRCSRLYRNRLSVYLSVSISATNLTQLLIKAFHQITFPTISPNNTVSSTWTQERYILTGRPAQPPNSLHNHLRSLPTSTSGTSTSSITHPPHSPTSTTSAAKQSATFSPARRRIDVQTPSNSSLLTSDHHSPIGLVSDGSIPRKRTSAKSCSPDSNSQ